MDIIEDAWNEPTELCSKVVVNQKKDGEKNRVSLDMTCQQVHKENQTQRPLTRRFVRS